MRLSVIKSNSIKNIILPDVIKGSFWVDSIDINGNKRNLILIEADGDHWKLISNRNVYNIVNNVMNPYAYLEVGNFYTIKNEYDKDEFIIYCSDVVEKYNSYELKDYLTKGFSIGKKDKNLVRYSLIDDIACYIIYDKNKLIIKDNDSKFGVYVNNSRVLNNSEIKIGDVIFIYGLKIIVGCGDSSNSYVIYVNDISNSNIKVDSISVGIVSSKAGNYTETYDETFYPLYDENDYFYKKPRIVPKLNTLDIVVDAPPQKVGTKESPLLLTIGPMATMSMSSLMMGYNTLNGITNGTTTLKAATPSLIVCGAMFASIFVWPLLTKFYQKMDNASKERKRQKKYSKYIDSKIEEISKAKNEQSSMLKMHYFSSEQSADVILNHSSVMWQRRISDDDFLTLNLGIGSCPMKINIRYPEEHFSMEEDNLKSLVSRLGKEPKNLDDVPVPYSLVKNYISGIFGMNYLHDYVKRLMVQLLAFHSYDDLKIVILTDEEHENEWACFKDAPHLFSDDKKIRFFASNNDEYKEVCYYLERVYESRVKNSSNIDIDKVYLIITDSFKKIRDIDVIKNILDNNNFVGFSLFMIDKKMTNFPDQCTSFIDLSLITKDNFTGEVKDNLNIDNIVKFNVDLNSIIDYEGCVKVLANTPIDIKNNVEGKLPNKIGFLEMYDVGKIEQLNPETRWKMNDPVLNLSAPVGVGKNGELITIDLHEKFHGPHGLIAGMTGSGKSEFIITYILSMAINYSPYEVQFILIDYKGGGLAGAFENRLTGIKLPHLIGTITNLDANEIKRSLASVESELKRRQSLFNQAREISGESTVDIYKYQRMYRQGVLSEPISHLFIICDEFAELKNQQPEFMEQLISTARIGRSLGVHLILATQKPSGVVDPQIWSNTRFRVCLRVQDTSDSNEVIKKPDAAYLKQTGRFYFQVGYDEVFTIGQAAYAGGSYIPSDSIKKEIDTSVDFINNIGYVIKKIETKIVNKTVVKSEGEELSNVVKYLSELATENNIKCRPLWLEKIPEVILVDALKVKYKYSKDDYILNLIIGEYDVPSMQEQRILTLPLTKYGNALIYGAAGSGKENFIMTMLYSSMISYNSNEANFYIVDLGSGSLNIFRKLNSVGDILQSNDVDKIENLFKMITSTINERKSLFSRFGGTYVDFIKNSPMKLPNIVIIINNFENFNELYSNYSDLLNSITRDCYKYGVYFVLTVNTPNGVRYKLRQNFSLVYALNQNNDEDFSTIINGARKNYPAKNFGRGLFKSDGIYEFQTAKVVDEKLNDFLNTKIDEYNTNNKYVATKVPILPEKITEKEIIKSLANDHCLVVGKSKDSLLDVKYDYSRDTINVITGLDLSIYNNFINAMINQLLCKKTRNIVVINADDYGFDEKYRKYYQYIDKDFDSFLTKMSEYISTLSKNFTESNYNKDVIANVKPIVIIIAGLDVFLTKIGASNKMVFENIVKDSNNLGIINFIILDTVDKIKKIEYDPWYKNYVNKNNGIWLGNGITNQFSINVTQKNPHLREELPNNFCFVVNRGKAEYVKFVEVFNLNSE